MINKLTIESFKSARDVEIELGNVNVFIGANGCGKSNILEAVGVLGAAASGRVDSNSLLARGVRPGVPRLFKSSFKNYRAKTFIHIMADWTQDGVTAHYGAGLWNPHGKPDTPWKYHSESWTEGTERLAGKSPRSMKSLNSEIGEAAARLIDVSPEDRPASIFLRALRDYCVYAPVTSVMRSMEMDVHSTGPIGVSGGGLPEAVLELLRQRKNRTPDDYYFQVTQEAASLIDWCNQYGFMQDSTELLPSSVRTGRPVLRFWDRFMAEGRNVITGYDASEGALYVLLCAVLAAHPAVQRVFAIDNFDHGLNPRLSRALTEKFCKWVLDAPVPRQVLLTSHTPQVLDGLDLLDDRIRLFAVDRLSGSGETSVRRIEVDEQMMSLAKKESMSLSRLWVQGFIGGVPNV